MKTSNLTFLPLLFVGIFITAAFGSAINNSIARPDSWVSHLLLPGYTVGLIVICSSMIQSLSGRVKDLESKIQKLEHSRS